MRRKDLKKWLPIDRIRSCLLEASSYLLKVNDNKAASGRRTSLKGLSCIWNASTSSQTTLKNFVKCINQLSSGRYLSFFHTKNFTWNGPKSKPYSRLHLSRRNRRAELCRQMKIPLSCHTVRSAKMNWLVFVAVANALLCVTNYKHKTQELEMLYEDCTIFTFKKVETMWTCSIAIIFQKRSTSLCWKNSMGYLKIYRSLHSSNRLS